MTIARVLVALALAALAGCAGLPAGPATASAVAPIARPVAEITQGEVTIMLAEEPCALAAVTNLPHRAVWREPKGGFEGCWGLQLGGGLVVIYFNDRTAVGIPLSAFGAPGGAAAPQQGEPRLQGIHFRLSPFDFRRAR